MKNFSKVIGFALVIFIVTAVLLGIYKMLTSNWFVNASFINVGLVLFAVVVVFYFAVWAIRKMWTLSFVLVFFAYACNYAKSNQQVVVSDDCGVTWKAIKAGESIPKGGMNPCYMKVVMPNYPMQGDSRFISNFKDRVRASIHIDYDYSITNPLAFIKQAKYLGKANTDADSDEALSGEAFEGAENMVIDKRIRDVSKAIFLDEDIVELEQADLEVKLLDESNKILEPFGIRLNFITLTFDLDEQTRQAIDVSTAMKIYESKNISDVGKQVMSQRAGAPKIIIENKVAEGAKAD